MVKRMKLGEQENVVFFKFGLIIPAVQKCLFRHLCISILPPATKNKNE